MRRRQAVLALVGAGFVALGLLTVFAVELANTQAKSKQDVKSRVHERAVLAGALIDSLFQSVQQQIPQQAVLYGTRTVSPRTMDKNRQGSVYVALLDQTERVIAHSQGFTAQAHANFGHSAALALVRAGHPYGLGNILPYGRSSVINFAVVLPTRFGPRTLVTGFSPSELSTFIAGELRRIPGVRGARSYLVEGTDTVLASTDPTKPIGYTFRQPDQVKALARPSADVGGEYYDQVRLVNSTWRIVLAAPTGPLFANVTGLHKWVPWLIFVALALVGVVAMTLWSRLVKSSREVRVANSRLKVVNDELANTNKALEHRAEELVRSNAELEQFASIASHDLQEPLRKIRTFTQQLTVREASNLSDAGQDYLQRTNAAAARMQKLIEDLLAFSRVATRGRPFEPIDLNALTREVLVDLSDQVSRASAVVRVGELPTISADELQVRQLIQNMVSNALKFRREDVVPEVTIDATVTDEETRISVRDNGIGFEDQYADRIFRIFERLHGRGSYPGTGIGLALCRKIAERHGGTVIAESEAGVGSTFTAILAVRQEDAAAAARTVATNGGGDSHIQESEEAQVDVVG